MGLILILRLCKLHNCDAVPSMVSLSLGCDQWEGQKTTQQMLMFRTKAFETFFIFIS